MLCVDLGSGYIIKNKLIAEEAEMKFTIRRIVAHVHTEISHKTHTIDFRRGI